jgi:hypothetical protein|uniref:Hedgehog/Intein (Hint) domain-containing protein n=1 Tax=viral metagenome TaxID=1070528 RepID=A0A6C0ISD2_9ZZZZ
MENNLKFIKLFPNKIKKINLKSLSSFDMQKNNRLNGMNITNIKSDNQFINDLLFVNDDNKILILNSDFQKLDILYTSDDDNVNHFGYSYFVMNKKLCITGFNKVGYPIIYIYNSDNKFELENKLILESLKGNYYTTYINDKLYILQNSIINEINYLVIYNLKIYENEIKIENVVKIQLSDTTLLFSITSNYLFVSNNKHLYIVNLDSYQVILKEQKDCLTIESFIFPNDEITVISHEFVEIFDGKLNLKQKIEVSDIEKICFSNSYLLLSDFKNNIIHIYALNQNSIFIEFAKISNIGKITNINIVNNRIIFKVDGLYKYIDLPIRFYIQSNLTGYGFNVSNDNILQGRYKSPIFIENGKLTTHKLNETTHSLLVGYTSTVSDLIDPHYNTNLYSSFEYNQVTQEEFKLVEKDLKLDYILISNELDISNKNFNKLKINFIFIEEQNIFIYLKAVMGSTFKIKINDNESLILWKEDGIIILEILNHDSLIEINTSSDIEILGYIKNINSKKQNYQINLMSQTNDILVNSQLLHDYQTFFPYIDNNNINGIVTKPIENVDITFELLPIKINLPSYSNGRILKINDYNQSFTRRYLIENNEKSILVTDLLSNNMIAELKTNNIKNIKKIIYVNPILIILTKTHNNIDSSLHIINTHDNKLVPYIISNTSKENLTEFFICNSNTESLLSRSEYSSKTHKNALVFVTFDQTNYIIYIVNLDESNMIDNMKKIIFKDEIKKMKLFNNYLVVESYKKEIVIYDIDTCTTLISFTDDNLISFDIFYNHFIVLLFNTTIEKAEVYIYKIKPTFELLFNKSLPITNKKSELVFGPGRIIIYDDQLINIYNFDDYNGIVKVDEKSEKYIHYYKNVLITKNNIDSDFYNIYTFRPRVNYIDMHVSCNVQLDKLIFKNKEGTSNTKLNLFLGVEPTSEISINGLETVNFKSICNTKSIVKMIIELKNQDEFSVRSLDKKITFCGIIVGDMKDKLPCFMPGTLISTPSGEVLIEELEDHDIIYDENNQEVEIMKVHKWETTIFVKTNIPYIIPAHSLKENYPKYDTYVSPYHKIKLPNGDFKRLVDINLPFIKQCKSSNEYLQMNDKKLDKIIYYNFILKNNSNFIANNLIVESLDESNPRIIN